MAFNPFGEGIPQQLRPNGKTSPLIGLKRPGGLLVQHEKQAFEIFSTLHPTSQYDLFPQVHVLQIFSFDEATLGQIMSERCVKSEIQQQITTQLKTAWNVEMGWKSVDFLVCERGTSKILGGIEIDGASHDDPVQQASDIVKNILFVSASIPLLRFTDLDIIRLHLTPMPLRQRTFKALLRQADAVWKNTAQALSAGAPSPARQPQPVPLSAVRA